ncbi:MAG: hypothetical protein ACOC1O_00275 [bacterium]
MSNNYTMIMFRSIYVNDSRAENIPTDWYYVNLSKKELEKLSADQYYDSMLHIYSKIFSTDNNVQKLTRVLNQFS